MMSGEETLAAREETLTIKSEVARLKFAQLEQNQARLTAQRDSAAPAPAPAPAPTKKKPPAKAKPAKAVVPESESEDETEPEPEPEAKEPEPEAKEPEPEPEPEPEAEEPLMNDDDLNELEQALSDRYVTSPQVCLPIRTCALQHTQQRWLFVTLLPPTNLDPVTV